MNEAARRILLRPYPRRAQRRERRDNARSFVLVCGDRIVGPFGSATVAEQYIWREALTGTWRVIEMERQAFSPLPPGVLVDPLDLPLVAAYRWYIGANGYVARSVQCKTHGRTNEYLHRFIMGSGAEGLQVDHINRNKLDNRRANMRAVTLEVNRHNVSPRSLLGVRGVGFMPSKGKYRARHGAVHIGLFNTIDEAAAAARDWRLANLAGAVD